MKFLTFAYWFNIYPGSLIPWIEKGLIVFIALLLGLVFAANFYSKKGISAIPKLALRKLFNFGIANFCAGLILLFFTREAIPFFSSRFWFLIWFLAMGFYLFKFYQKLESAKIKKAASQKQAENEKYIPKKSAK